MLKLQTPVETPQNASPITYQDKILVLGSCFADNIGIKMQQAGLNVCVNPFGTLYNPQTIRQSLDRLATGTLFTDADCVEMGANAGLICSFSHHTSFARPTRQEFLDNANKRLAEARAFYHECNIIIITFGTAWVYKHGNDGIVSNCLKRRADEFQRLKMTVSEISALYTNLLAQSNKRFIFTVSPIRHLKDGAHGNQISKSTLLLAIDDIIHANNGDTPLNDGVLDNPSNDSILKKPFHKIEYFPSYEIVLDELRDYRFYAEDLTHPSNVAVNYIWERFTQTYLTPADQQRAINEAKHFRQSLHIPLH